jgi:hypothetical protein
MPDFGQAVHVKGCVKRVGEIPGVHVDVDQDRGSPCA